jgi:FGGY-family pentulose kinase
MAFVCAVDVGTGSARAAVLDKGGAVLARHDHPIRMNQPRENFAEHSSEDIWFAVCTSVRAAVAASGVDPQHIAGIGFDATCSLVWRDRSGQPISVSPDGDAQWNTLVWLDHRALAEADACTATGHRVLNHVGGRMSPEMQVPKAMWLKRNLPERWAQSGALFDLADFLTWKATGSTARSQCTLACKWTYLPHATPHWQADFLNAVDLDDFLQRAGLPETAAPVDRALGTLTADAAQALGLTTATRVAPGLIDAYAGTLGLLGRFAGEPHRMERQLALIAGTSSCLMTIAREPVTMPGGWGPYLGVTLPGFWVTEGGQSATGALLDYIIRSHGAGGDPTSALHQKIAARIAALRAEQGYEIAGRLHVLSDFHGNRTPLADPHALGVISGLSLDGSFDGLAKLYWRTAVAIALGTRQILDALEGTGSRIDTLHLTGGHARNPLLPELYADVTGRDVIVYENADAMLTGSGMLAAVAGGLHPDLPTACAAMAHEGTLRRPNAAARRRVDMDFFVFLEMQKQRRVLEDLMS